MRLDELWWGGMPVDFDEQQKRLVHDAQPAYPDVARQAGVEGTVRLRIVVGKDGGVQEIRPLAGPLVLVNAAIAAVKEWRYKPLILDGEAQPVVTTVIIEFRLQ
jgi:protein TonB